VIINELEVVRAEENIDQQRRLEQWEKDRQPPKPTPLRSEQIIDVARWESRRRRRLRAH
jgi:hypothetical protein